MTSDDGRSQQAPDKLTSSVRGMLDRQAIKDCLARYARGIDRLDRALILSAFHPDAIDEHGKFVGNPGQFADWVLEAHATHHFSHQHVLLNHRCELAGDLAHSETYFMFVAMSRAGRPLTMNGGRYVDRFERRAGRWAIARRVLLRDWGALDERPDMADLSSFTSNRASLDAAVRAFMNGGPAASRDRRDASYQRPLECDPSRLRAFLELQARRGRS